MISGRVRSQRCFEVEASSSIALQTRMGGYLNSNKKALKPFIRGSRGPGRSRNSPHLVIFKRSSNLHESCSACMQLKVQTRSEVIVVTKSLNYKRPVQLCNLFAVLVNRSSTTRLQQYWKCCAHHECILQSNHVWLNSKLPLQFRKLHAP